MASRLTVSREGRSAAHAQPLGFGAIASCRGAATMTRRLLPLVVAVTATLANAGEAPCDAPEQVGGETAAREIATRLRPVRELDDDLGRRVDALPIERFATAGDEVKRRVFESIRRLNEQSVVLERASEELVFALRVARRVDCGALALAMPMFIELVEDVRGRMTPALTAMQREVEVLEELAAELSPDEGGQ